MAARKRRRRSDHVQLDDLRTGAIHGIHPDVGAGLAQAATLCLEDCRHRSGVSMKVDGSFRRNLPVRWRPVEGLEQARRSWDPQVATEWGACGVAALLVEKLTKYTIVEKATKWLGSRRGSGFDYWLGEKGKGDGGPLFQGKARLEVSGIRTGDASAVGTRVEQKEVQTEQSDSLGIEAYVAVVEFGTPRSRITKRCPM